MHCSIETELEDCEFAFYFDINGERKETKWYSTNNFATYEFGDEIVHIVRIIFFVREANGTIHSESVEKRTHWSYCDGVLAAVELLTDQNSIILEFGSGYGSNEIAKIRTIFSVEHDDRFVGLYPDVNYIYAPLKPIANGDKNGKTHWYDAEVVSTSLPEKIDLILVDGPPSAIGRLGLLNILEKFPDNSIWIIDDVLRTEDQSLANRICLNSALIQYRFWNFSILSKQPIHSEKLQQIHETSLEVISHESSNYLQQYYSNQ